MITSPTQISNCVVWLDATDTTTLSSLSGGAGNSLINASLTGDFVGGWGDKSGNNRNFLNNFGSLSNRPTWISSLSTVRFDGIDDYLTETTSITLTAQTVFVIYKPNSIATSQRIYTQAKASGFDDSAGTPSPYVPIQHTGSTNTLAIASYPNTTINTNLRSIGIYDVVVAYHTGSNASHFVNGLRGPTTNNFTLGTTFVRSRIGAYVHGSTTGVGNYLNGDISEVIVYDKALSNAEREDVEYYLTRKWSFLNVIPRQVYAIQNGNWSNSTTWSTSADPAPWTFPLSSDNVYSNTFTVTADQNIRVTSLQTAALSPNNIAAGGTFAITQPNITIAPINGFTTAGTTACITGLLSSGTSILSGNIIGPGVSHAGNGELRVIGNVTGGSVALAHGVNNNGNGLLSIYGNVFGGSIAGSYGANNNSTGTLVVNGSVRGNTGIGIYNASLGNCTIVGGISGGSAHGLHNQYSGVVYLSGECRGGTAGSIYGINNNAHGLVRIDGNLRAGSSGYTYAARNLSLGTFIIRGNIQATDSAPAFLQSSTGTTLLTGDIIASSANNAYESSSTGARNEFTGSLINDISGRQAIYVARYLLRPQMFNSYTRMAGPSATNTPVFYYAPESYSTTYVPHASSVRAGVTYAAVSALSGVAVNIPTQLIGTMQVPSPASVSLNVPVESTTGTGIVSPASLQQLWSVSLDNIKTSNSLGTRLKNVATIQEVGNLLAYGSNIIPPDTIPGLQLWLDAADSSTLFDATAGGNLVTTDGAAVARWQDKSGNNRHATQATASARPLLRTGVKNGRNVLRFDGTNDILTSTCSINGFTSATVFGVFKRTGTLIGASFGYSASPAAGLRLYGENGYPVSFDGRPTGSSAFSSSVAVAGQSTNFVLAGGICTTTNMTAYLNGTASVSTNVSISTIIAQNRTDIGALNPPGQNFCSGDYSEILIYNSALTTTQRQAVEAYLNNKWGIY